MERNGVYKKSLIALFIILWSALAARMLVGVLYFNTFDTFWYRNWAFSLPGGFFDVYSRADEISLDYPPLYLFCLYLTGLAYRFFGADCGNMLQMFLMKFWPIVFDVCCTLMVYIAARKWSETGALFAAALWAANPSVFFNTAFWGQTDALMAFLLIAAFYLADSERPVWACVMFAVAGLTKYQSLFFTPVLLIFIFRRFGIKRLLCGIGAAAATVAAVFMPFMLGARNPWLFFDVYLGGAGTYKYLTFNAYNIYGLFSLNTVDDSTAIIGGFNFVYLNFLVLAAIIVFVGYLMLKGKNCDIYVGSLLIMQCIFMLSTRMHERYQIVALPFALLAFVKTRERGFAWQFAGLTALTLINQAIILFYINFEVSYVAYMPQIMQFFSALNLVLFIHTVYVCAKFFMKGDGKNDLLTAKKAYPAPTEE